MLGHLIWRGLSLRASIECDKWSRKIFSECIDICPRRFRPDLKELRLLIFLYSHTCIPRVSATTKAQHQVESGILLYRIVLECVSILQLLTGEDQALLVWRDSFFVVYFGFDVLYSVVGFTLECYVSSSEGLHEYLHIAM